MCMLSKSAFFGRAFFKGRSFGQLRMRRLFAPARSLDPAQSSRGGVHLGVEFAATPLARRVGCGGRAFFCWAKVSAGWKSPKRAPNMPGTSGLATGGGGLLNLWKTMNKKQSKPASRNHHETYCPIPPKHVCDESFASESTQLVSDMVHFFHFSGSNPYVGLEPNLFRCRFSVGSSASSALF